MIERQGRAFCLYAGLLDLAHEQGLKSVRTEMLQVPVEANRMVAICSATVVVERDGVERTFTGIGDAAPNNVAPTMQSCLIRMAETRAKARALRDAVNIGVAAFEELGDDPPAGAEPPTRQGSRRQAAERSRCEHCPVTDGRPGPHHKPGCPNRQERAAVG